MYLTREEERILAGEEGPSRQLAMKLIVRVGEALGAERLVRVSHVHVSGVSYSNIGDYGLEFIETLAASGRVAVYSTFNPAGFPLGDVEPPYTVPSEDARKQKRIIDALIRMGFEPSGTCIPYTLREPRPGEHLAWGESSAVAVANTLYGARTNREGGPVALAAALVGRTYLWGLHLDENRRPTKLVKVEASIRDGLAAGVLGYIVGSRFSGEVPYIDVNPLDKWQVVSLCAAAAASGSTAMCVIKGVSPEDQGPPLGVEKVAVDRRDIEAAREEVETAGIDEAELFFTGCPHHPKRAVSKILQVLERYGVSRLRRPIWIAIPGGAAGSLRKAIAGLRERGIHVLPGTCLVVSTLSKAGIRAIATDSVKTAFYMPRRHGVRVALSSLEDFVKKYGV
ncbi:aconitase X catalytic domain-containing protein [Pyrodictium abyssi]|uniref:Phosphomevalonate dehydratase large subunit n=1 Tax=Pyrodictium abyssi TaxID=54256 RepID=A0ABN6ZKA4_9CREN|nr:aconitase X [Pyrodictium abyssi]